MIELWKDMKDLRGCQISNMGRIKKEAEYRKDKFGKNRYYREKIFEVRASQSGNQHYTVVMGERVIYENIILEYFEEYDLTRKYLDNGTIENEKIRNELIERFRLYPSTWKTLVSWELVFYSESLDISIERLEQAIKR